jgi:hypothetical protein
MNSLKLGALALLLIPALTVAQTTGAVSPPPLAFDAEEFLKPPTDMHLGEIAGVAVNAKGSVFVFQRGNTSGPAYGAAAAQLLEFDAKGKFVREIGKNLYAWSYAHAVRVDPEGNIWAIDKGSDMVVKFNNQGRVVMVFGRKPEASDGNAHPIERVRPPLPPSDGTFRQVTDIAWDSKGNGYISDGYINSRVAKVSKDGQWLASFGEPGGEPGQFNTLHSIASDAHDRIYVADRGNRRIQVLDTEGKVVKIITVNVPAPADAPAAMGRRPTTGPDGFSSTVNVPGAGTMMPGAPWAICITPPTAGKEQYLFVADAFPGRIYKLTLDGKVLGWLGGSGKQLKQFGWIHEMACPNENELFVAELLNWRLQKLTLHPTAEQH